MLYGFVPLHLPDARWFPDVFSHGEAYSGYITHSSGTSFPAHNRERQQPVAFPFLRTRRRYAKKKRYATLELENV
jgi:hypothetical protein